MQGFTAFKYCGAERAIQCLEDGSLYLAHRGQLNDTLEVRFDTADAEAFVRIFEQTLSEVGHQRNESAWRFNREAFRSQPARKQALSRILWRSRHPCFGPAS